MVLLISENYDVSTNDVMDWLIFQKKQMLRLNSNDYIKIENVTLSKHDIENTTKIKINNKTINISDITSVWYRRGQLLTQYNKTANYFKKSRMKKFENFSYGLNQEGEKLLGYIYNILGLKRKLCSFNHYTLNKLNVLKMAAEIGLSIPKTYVLDNKLAVSKIIKTNTLIIKAIHEIPSFEINNSRYYGYTVRVSQKELVDFPDEFYPTLFQIEVEKKIELRCFYINKKIFSMAIFSQDDEQTSVDFRRYNNEDPNRTTPFKLPKEIEIKIIKLMTKLKLNTGSIDIILNSKNEYIFLEINPVGQFGMVSYPCNYFIEKEIASFLT